MLNKTIGLCQTDLMLVITGAHQALGEMNAIRKPGRSKDGPGNPDAQPRGHLKKTTSSAVTSVCACFLLT
jgi:hypothetical protein